MTAVRKAALAAMCWGCTTACSIVPEPFPDLPDAAPIDAYSAPVELELRVSKIFGHENPDLVVTVDGVPVAPDGWDYEVGWSFSSYQAAKVAPFVVETWFGESLLFRRVEVAGVCEECMRLSERVQTPTLERVGLCLEPSGELRYGSPLCRFPWGDGCAIDAFCDPPCYPVPGSWLGCGEGLGCGLVVVVEDPFYGHFDCVPAGQTPIGGPCVRGPPGLDTGHDDCAVGGACLGGVCREVCAENRSCSDGSPCDLFPRMRDSIGVCRGTRRQPP